MAGGVQRELRNIVRQQKTTGVQSQISRRKLRKAVIYHDQQKSSEYARWVRVKKTGGDWGSATQQCSWIYDLYKTTGVLNDDNLIIRGVDNVYGRAAQGRYVAARDGTLALARLNPGGEPTDPNSWMLLVVIDEVEDVAVCDSAPVGG